MAPALVLRLRALVASCFRWAPAPAPALEDHDIIQEIGSAPATATALEHDINLEVGSAPALVDDDILREILIRLPLLPSSLLHASLVCKRWCRVISDPFFLRRATPPLLGFFCMTKPVFTPLLRPPNRIPSDRFSLPVQPRHRHLHVYGVRHGLVLLLNQLQFEAVVWDPVTGRHHTVPYAPDFRVSRWESWEYCNHGDVLRSSAADGDGGGFKVVLYFTRARMSDHGNTSVFMSVYESATGQWSQTSSTVIPSSFLLFLPTVLVTNALCGFFHWSAGILEFDLDTNTVGMIQKPKNFHSPKNSVCRVVRTQDRGLGLAKLSATIIQLWGRRTHGDADDAEWVLQKTVDLDKLVFPLLATTSMRELHFPRIVGYDEDNNVIHVAVSQSVFTVNLESLKYIKVFDGPGITYYYPYTSFYTLIS